MKVYDHRKIYRHVYKAKGQIEIIEVPNLQFIVAEGIGARDVYEMHTGEALWSISRVTNRLKDMTKTQMGYKFTLMPLEIIWERLDQDEWSWRSMMQVPEIITEEMFQHSLIELEKRKRNIKVPLKLVAQPECTSVQGIHLGPYSSIPETIEMLESFCKVNGYTIQGHFREIYINQPFCNPPEKLQTILRAEVLNNRR
ncbi:GyrI-like domain-containing protein [Peribacillus acanthi]|uniref:GyrI-like domain-containing protein n=1 Tax=Peribacillus acanthi TaxID=2171554 RepID=UPI000D3EBAAD|nr:GyrI-like domain-containing protein [Peribacillus acanthi]